MPTHELVGRRYRGHIVENPAEDLKRSYAAMLEARSWQGDTPQDGVSAEEIDAAPPSPVRIVEALLFVGGAPLTAQRAQEIIRGFSPEQFTEALDALNRAYRAQNRPYTILARGDGYSLSLRPKYNGIKEKLYGGQREARLSTAAIDVLALVAYRQPATKAEIDSLRGADSAGLLRQLVRRGLIQVVYRADAVQREVSYGTTPRFLEWFGLKSLDDLPRTQDLQQL
jgi:segregation and condensation protein B